MDPTTVTTDPPANTPTSGTDGKNGQADGTSGGGTQTPVTSEGTQTDKGKDDKGEELTPAQLALIKQLADSGLEVITPKQKNAMAKGIRLTAEQEFKAKQEQLEAEARRKEQEEQGNFKGLYETLKPVHDALQAKAQKYEAALSQHITEATKDWPAKIRDKDPGEEDYEKRLSWFEDFRDIAQEMLESKGVMPSLRSPQPLGATGSGNLAQDYLNRKHAQATKQ